jgi:hypothetical protein
LGALGFLGDKVLGAGRFETYSSHFYYCDDRRGETEIVCTPAIDNVEPYTGLWLGNE